MFNYYWYFLDFCFTVHSIIIGCSPWKISSYLHLLCCRISVMNGYSRLSCRFGFVFFMVAYKLTLFTIILIIIIYFYIAYKKIKIIGYNYMYWKIRYSLKSTHLPHTVKLIIIITLFSFFKIIFYSTISHLYRRCHRKLVQICLFGLCCLVYCCSGIEGIIRRVDRLGLGLISLCFKLLVGLVFIDMENIARDKD